MKNIFICGFGRRARHHLAAIQAVDGLEVVGVFDPAPAMRAEAAQAQLAVFGDVEQGLRQSRPDTALVCTPPSVRFELVELLARTAGIRAIIVEKPLALTPGRLGDVRFLRAACFGKLFDQGSHLVDLLHWLMPGRRVEWVDATACNSLPDLARLGVLSGDYRADEAHPGALWSSALLRFDDGAEATVTCGALDRVARPELGPWLQKRIAVFGSAGSAEAHVASHYREWNAHDQTSTPVDPTDYAIALTRMYRALGDTAGVAVDPHEEIATLDVMSAMLESGRRHRPLSIADARQADDVADDVVGDVTRTPDEKASCVSVILPLGDHRGMGLRALASWTVAQRCAASDFEVIVMLDPATQALEPQLRPLLRPQDRIVHCAKENEMSQYHRGAGLARGDILLFTEPHCIAEPQAIGELLAGFRDPSVDGLCGRSTPLCANGIATAEARMFDDGFVDWSRPGMWSKVILRAFALRRKIYFDVGGFQHHYSRFAEWLLAATLHRRGYHLVYAPGVSVAHLYADNFPLLDEFIDEFTEGECRFRLESGDASFCFEYFGAPPEWTEARSHNSILTRKSLRHLSGLLLWPRKSTRSIAGYIEAVCRLLALLPTALLGVRLLVWRWRVRVLWAQLRIRLFFWSAERQYRAFLDYYGGTTSLCRVRSAAAAPYPAHVSAPVANELAVVDALDGALFGFHSRENFNGTLFRWSSGISAVRLDVAPGRYRVRIELLDVHAQHPPRETVFFMNDELLRDVVVDKAQNSISVGIEPAHFGETPWLMLFVRSLTFLNGSSPESRALGLPVRRILLEPA